MHSIKLSDKRTREILFAVIVCLQLFFITYWAAQKENLFLDEEYSLEYANYYIDNDRYRDKLPYTETFMLDTWVEAKDLKAYYSVEPEESIFQLSPAGMIKLLFRRRIYFGLLNMSESLLSPGKVSIVPAFVLNMIIFVFIQIALYRVLRKFKICEEYALWGVTFYGFSSLIIGHTLFIRFYSFTILLFLLVILLHQKMWEETKTGMFILEEGLALILLYLSLKCSELTMIYGGAFVGMYLLMMILNKKWKEAGIYGLPMIGISLWYLGTKTELLNILFHPSQYTNSSYAKAFTTNNVLKATPESVFFWLRINYNWAGTYLFGNVRILSGILCVLLYLCIRKRNDHPFRDPSQALFLAMLISVLVHILFASLAGLFFMKYVCVAHTMFMIVLLYVFDRVARNIPRQKAVQIILYVLLAAIMAVTYSQRNVEYLFEEHTETLRRVHEYEDLDILLVTENKDIHHSIYDCVYNAGNDARIYYWDMTGKLNEEDIPAQVLVWTREGSEQDFSEYLTDYDVELIGNTKDSTIYHAVRRNMNE